MSEEVIGLLFGVKGGGDINRESGRLIVDDLTKIVNSINEGKSSIPKIELEVELGDSKKILEDLKKELESIKNLAKDIKIPQGSSGGKGTSENYRKMSASIKQYYSELAKLEKIRAKNSNVTKDETSGLWGDSNENSSYKARISNINNLKKKYDELGITVSKTGEINIKSAEELGVTEQERLFLLEQAKSSMTSYAIATEKNSKSVQDAWDKNAAKVHEYIQRVREVAGKDSDVTKMMDELDALTVSGDKSKLDDLTTKFTRLQQKIRETGADVETWGQKMSKTFGTRVRSLLAGITVGKVTQYLHEVYTNVVNIDKAVVNLQIASGKTRSEVQGLIKDYAKLGKELGATTIEVAESADTWLRQGYSIEDANTLISNSMMLSKLGQMESASAATALTSAMKGYNIAVEDSINIVDKFTAVDMVAAANAGDLATAMAETATGARIAGVSMDKLIGYIAVVKEVTQDGAESVGTFYRTLFARMNNVAAGKFVDEETGESLNDVETVLGELGISLRGANNEFRNSAEVLDEVASRWSTFDNVAQHAIATAFAGTRQQEKFVTLMEHYGDAVKYAGVATESGGTAIEKYESYLEGIQGSLNTLKAAFEEFSMAALDSGLITGFIDLLSGVLNVLTWIVDKVGGLNSILYATISIVAVLKVDSIWEKIKKGTDFITSLTSSLKAAKVEGVSAGKQIQIAFGKITAGASAAQIAVGATAAAIGVLLIAFNAFRQAREKKIADALDSAEKSLGEAESVKEEGESLESLIKKYEELAKKSGGAWDDKTVAEVKGIQNDIVNLVGVQSQELDLVNGKLETELEILKSISAESKNASLEAAQAALADAELAIRRATSNRGYFGLERFGAKAYNLGWPETSGNIVTEAGAFDSKQIKVGFGTAAEFVRQYEAVLNYKNSIASSFDETDVSDVELYSSLNEFISEFKDVYEAYKSANDLVNQIMSPSENDSNNGFTSQINNSTGQLKSFLEILESVQGEFDIINQASADMDEYGYLSADTLSKLLDPENGYPALEKYLTMTADGYTIASDALDKFVKLQQTSYVAALAATEEGTEAYDVAYQNLERFLAVISTLQLSKEIERETKALEDERDAWEDQLDRYKDLIDLRKELLETYADELEYQKELEKKQRNVARLQTRLSVARLDNSAGGQARVRALEAELKEAQEDLEDFTLEHAIDVLTNQLDSQYRQYENFIEAKLSEITAAINGVSSAVRGSAASSTEQIKQLLEEYKKVQPSSLASTVGLAGLSLVPGTVLGAMFGSDSKSTSSSSWFETILHSGSWSSVTTPAQALQSGMSYATAKAKGLTSGYTENEWNNRRNKAYPAYHTGGFVGDAVMLSSNEEFAKLLKGEFVSTPSQMRHFMEDTLPKIANYTATGGITEFNAPLIEVLCDSVTSESLPELERVVNEAVEEIKRQLDSGMSRTGFNRTPARRLI